VEILIKKSRPAKTELLSRVAHRREGFAWVRGGDRHIANDWPAIVSRMAVDTVLGQNLRPEVCKRKDASTVLVGGVEDAGVPRASATIL